MKLNDENIDEIMFQLLEGEIQGEERQLLLDAINADKDYSKQWQAWQHTILNPNDEMLVMDTNKLIKHKDNTVFIWWKYAAAAMIIITFSMIVYVGNKKSDNGIVGHENTPPSKNLIIKVPAIAPVTTIIQTTDSVVTIKQKIQMIAEHPKTFRKLDVPVQKVNQAEKAPIQIVDESSENQQHQVPTPKEEEKQNENDVAVHESSDGVFMTVYTENGSKNIKQSAGTKLDEKRNLLTRIFSKPNLKIESDSNTYSKRKFIIENKAYKIIAGF